MYAIFKYTRIRACNNSQNIWTAWSNILTLLAEGFSKWTWFKKFHKKGSKYESSPGNSIFSANNNNSVGMSWLLVSPISHLPEKALTGPQKWSYERLARHCHAMTAAAISLFLVYVIERLNLELGNCVMIWEGMGVLREWGNWKRGVLINYLWLVVRITKSAFINSLLSYWIEWFIISN